MKNIIFFILILPVLFFISCSSNDVKKGEKMAPPKKVILSGKVEVSPQENRTDVYIVQNWKTKSKISYKVKNKEKVIKMDGKILELDVLLYPMKSPWSGEIEIIRIIKEVK